MGCILLCFGFIGLVIVFCDGVDLVQMMWEEIILFFYDFGDWMVRLFSGYGYFGQVFFMGVVWLSFVSVMIDFGQVGVDVIVDVGWLGLEILFGSFVFCVFFIGIVMGFWLCQLVGLFMRVEEVEVMFLVIIGIVGFVIVGFGCFYNLCEIGYQFGFLVFGDVVFNVYVVVVLFDGELVGKCWL